MKSSLLGSSCIFDNLLKNPVVFFIRDNKYQNKWFLDVNLGPLWMLAQVMWVIGFAQQERVGKRIWLEGEVS